MDHRMSRRTFKDRSVSYLLFTLALLISSCDGGISGTGLPEMDINASAAPEESIDTANTADVVDENIEPNAGDSVSTPPPTDVDTNEPAGGAPTNSNGSSIDGASDGGSDAGSADGGTDGAETSDSITDGASLPGVTEFTNTVATLDGTDARVNLINASTVPVNVIETGAPNTPVLFGGSGIDTNVVSGAATLTELGTSLEIVDNSAQTESVFNFLTFDVVNASFSTIVVRQNAAAVDAIALITETQTTDSALARVRVVQAATLGNAALETLFDLNSAGANPGGIDESFGPLSFNAPVSAYTDIPNGDYELIDPAGRFENQSLNFAGANVYTIVVTGDSANPVLLVNDTEAANAPIVP